MAPHQSFFSVTTLAAAVIGLTLSTAQAEDWKENRLGTLQTRIQEHEQLDELEQALGEHDAMEMAMSSAEHQYTVIALSDQALGTLSEADKADLTAIPEGERVSPLFDHYVIPETVYVDELLPGESKTYHTVGDDLITITRFGPDKTDIIINGSNVTDITAADNGMLMVLDTTLHTDSVATDGQYAANGLMDIF